MDDTIVLQDPRLKMQTREGKLTVNDGEKILAEFPIVPVHRVMVFGNTQITTQALKLCLEEGVEVLYFSAYGKFLGTVSPFHVKDNTRRLAQYRVAADNYARVRWSQALIAAKIQSCEVEYRRITDNRWHAKDGDFLPLCRKARKQLTGATTLSEIMGIEGRMAKRYFELFGESLPPSWHWTRRAYHPAPDAINALLSFLYGICRSLIDSECRKAGLDPALGFLHSGVRNDRTLADDLLELFRVPVADHTALKLIQSGTLPQDMFHRTANGVRMQKDALKLLLDYTTVHWQLRLTEKLKQVTKELQFAAETGESPDFMQFQAAR